MGDPALKKLRTIPSNNIVPDKRRRPFPKDFCWSCDHWLCIAVEMVDKGRPPADSQTWVERVSWAYGSITADEYPRYESISANAQGQLSGKSLGYLMSDIIKVVRDNKGRVAMHNLDYGKSVLAAEFCKAGHDANFWSHAATNGLCTMDTSLHQWVFGVDSQQPCEEDSAFVASEQFPFHRMATAVLPGKKCRTQSKLCWFVVQKLHQMAIEQVPA